MPEISRFYGLVIYMFFINHNTPHFKVVSGEYDNSVLRDFDISLEFIFNQCSV